MASTAEEQPTEAAAPSGTDQNVENEAADKEAIENGQSDDSSPSSGDQDAAVDDTAVDDAKASEATDDADKAEADEEQAPEAPPVEPIAVPAEAIRMEVDFRTYPADTFSHEHLDLGQDDLLDMLRVMLLQRRFEERCRQMYQRQKISGFLHLYIGQEAVSTGVARAIRLGEDSVITAYRDHGIALAMGVEPGPAMAELFGKKTGISKGKGGSMHFFDAERGLFGGHAIVGAHVPLGAGIAFAHKYRGEDNACLCLFGDGAAQQGAAHEAMNLAGLYDLPVIFMCENNQYGMGTSVERAAAEPDLFKHAVAYDMPGALVNGMDVFSVIRAVRDHLELAREGTPSFLEVRTYRYQGHSISDPAKYRAEGELDERKSQDPIVRMQRYLTENDLATDDEIDAMDDEVKQDVLDAIDFAEESDFPPEEAIYDDIYVQEDYPFITD